MRNTAEATRQETRTRRAADPAPVRLHGAALDMRTGDPVSAVRHAVSGRLVIPFPVPVPEPARTSTDMRTGRAYMPGKMSALAARAADARTGRAIARRMERARRFGRDWRAMRAMWAAHEARAAGSR